MFDGWTSGPRHYVAVYAVYTINGELRQSVLAIYLMESGQTAGAHIDLLSNILHLYEKDIKVIKFIASDDCATNQSIAAKLEVPLIGCASHHLNQAISKFVAQFCELTDPIYALMVQLRQPNNFAKLATHTYLRPIKSNATRCSSTYDMVERYMGIQEAVKKVVTVEV